MAFGKWTAGEDDILRAGLTGAKTGEEIMAALPGRTACAARKRANVLKLPNTGRLRRIDRASMSPDALLRRAQKDLEYQRATYAQPIQYKPRTCLYCRRSFLSWGPGNRLCADHRHADAYEMI